MKFLPLISIVLLFSSLVKPQTNLVISGFVDGSMAIPVDDGDMGFSFDGLEIDLEKELATGVALRADIDFAEPFIPMTEADDVVFGANVEQAYVIFTPLKIGDGGPTVTFGKFNAPIGYELLDAPDMYQFSHSLVFDYALPTNLSGISVAHDVGAGLDVVAYLANGWDVNAPDSSMIFGGRLGYTGIDGLAAGVSGIQDDSGDNFVIDIDAAVTMVPNLTLGFEFNTGHKDDAGDGITGWLVMGNYSFGNFAITLRQDAWGAAGSTTISPSMGIAEGAGVLFEYRLDTGTFDDDGVYTKGKNTSAAIEFTFTF